MSTSMVASCKNDAVKNTKKMLEEKYNTEFVVTRIGNSSFTKNGTVHSAFCHPENDESVLFEVWVNDEGTTFVDKYKEALLGHEMKKEASEIISELTNDYAMAIDVTGKADGYEEGEKINELSENIKAYVLLAINVDEIQSDISPSELYEAVETMYKNWNNIEGSLFLYIVDSDSMDEIKKHISSNPRLDSSLFDKCGEGFITDADVKGLKRTVTEMENVLF